MMVQQMNKDYWPLPKRVAFISALNTPDGQHEIEFPKGKIQPLNVYLVPISLPVYRLENGRTLASQQEYIVKHGKPDDFFTKDVESLEALQAQDQLLRGM